MNECTSEKIKASRYNHFVPLENGNRLAFNALSCGLAEMDPDSYRKYCDLIAGSEIIGDGDKDLIADLKKGGFITPADIDELDAIRAAHYQARFGGRGLSLTIIPTSACNFACDYCYEGDDARSRVTADASLMTSDVRENLVQFCRTQIQPEAGLSVTWYGGEPLLALPIVEELTAKLEDVCREKGGRYWAGMITNGYLLDESRLDALKRLHIGFIQVTIDGPRHIHDRRRCLRSGGGTYDRIVANLDRIEERSGISVSLRVNVDIRNAKDVPQLLREIKARAWHKRPNFAINFGQVLTYTTACRDIGSQCMATPQFSQFLIDAYRIALDMGFALLDFPSLHPTACGAVGTNCWVIEPNGDVQSCWNAVGNASMRTGVLTDKGIAPTDNYVRWLGWTPFVDREGQSCSDCNFLPGCMGGCPYKTIYPDATGVVETGSCVPHRHNLVNLLRLARVAQLRKLLRVKRATVFTGLAETGQSAASTGGNDEGKEVRK